MRRESAPGSAPGPVVYAIACGSPSARDVGRLVELAHQRGYQMCVVATPDGRKFLDVPTLSAQTGFPVRSTFKSPGEPDLLPGADAIVVAPATVNTISKWSCGIADTLALGLLIEGQGKGLPIVAVPFTNDAMARHPAFQEHLARLRSWDVRVLYGPDVVKLPPPGGGEAMRDQFPWELAAAALDEALADTGNRPQPAPSEARRLRSR